MIVIVTKMYIKMFANTAVLFFILTNSQTIFSYKYKEFFCNPWKIKIIRITHLNSHVCLFLRGNWYFELIAILLLYQFIFFFRTQYLHFSRYVIKFWLKDKLPYVYINIRHTPFQCNWGEEGSYILCHHVLSRETQIPLKNPEPSSRRQSPCSSSQGQATSLGRHQVVYLM